MHGFLPYRVGAALMALLALSAVPARAGVIVTTFGPSDSYDPAVSYGVFGMNSPFGPSNISAPFTPSADYTVSAVYAPFGGFGPNPVTLSLVADNAGLPTGATLVADTLTNVGTPSASIFTWVPSSPVSLLNGKTYWFVAEAASDDTFLLWRLNDQGINGVGYRTTGPWEYFPNSPAPAYRVEGIVAGAVPEPGASAFAAFAAIGLLGLAARVRQRTR